MFLWRSFCIYLQCHVVYRLFNHFDGCTSHVYSVWRLRGYDSSIHCNHSNQHRSQIIQTTFPILWFLWFCTVYPSGFTRWCIGHLCGLFCSLRSPCLQISNQALKDALHLYLEIRLHGPRSNNANVFFEHLCHILLRTSKILQFKGWE